MEICNGGCSSFSPSWFSVGAVVNNRKLKANGHCCPSPCFHCSTTFKLAYHWTRENIRTKEIFFQKKNPLISNEQRQHARRAGRDTLLIWDDARCGREALIGESTCASVALATRTRRSWNTLLVQKTGCLADLS